MRRGLEIAATCAGAGLVAWALSDLAVVPPAVARLIARHLSAGGVPLEQGRGDHMIVAVTPATTLTLDDLARRTSDELGALYRSGTAPSSMALLDGALEGRMLAVRRLDRGWVGRAVQRFAASDRFVWEGKSFQSTGEHVGAGINRIQLPGLLGRQQLFPFVTTFDASVLDGEPTVVLDYDLPDNPPYIRKVRDELRQVSPGVFLGPALWKARKGPALALWFALRDVGA